MKEWTSIINDENLNNPYWNIYFYKFTDERGTGFKIGKADSSFNSRYKNADTVAAVCLKSKPYIKFLKSRGFIVTVFEDNDFNKEANTFKTVDEFVNIIKDMNFDHIIMNPPYDKNLHLKILQEAIKHSDDVVNLSPIRWLQDPLAEYKQNSDWKKFEDIRKKIESLDVVPKDDVFQLFSITNSEDLGIYHLTEKGGWQNFDTKLLCKKCYDKIKNSLCTIDHNEKDGWRIRISSISNSNHRTGGLNSLGKLLIFKDGMKDGKPWYDFYQKNKWSKTTPEITDSIKFNSEDEAKNFIDSIENTKFGRWYEGHIITDMNICNMNILWLDDYTHKWTDEMLYKYFNLTQNEIDEIEKEIK